MLYRAYLKNRNGCPFCHPDGREIASGKLAYLTYALAPYSKNHLLVVPRRHVTSLQNLNAKEKEAINRMIERGAEILRGLKIKDYTILVRAGASKSIPHLHYHIIPNHRIGDLDRKGKPRTILTSNEVANLKKRLKK